MQIGTSPLSCEGKKRGAFFLMANPPRWLPFFLLASAAILLYSGSLGHNFLFDEESIVLKNPLLRSFSKIPDIFNHGYFYTGLPKASWNDYYRPLTLLTFTADYHFWGINPLGYNITNVFLHILVGFFLFDLLRKILKDDVAAFLPTFLFVVHPLATEAVTYLASRGDLLGALSVLLSLGLYFRSRRILSGLVFGLGLFTKESVVLLPAYLLFLDIAFFKNSPGRLMKNLLPFILLAVSYLLFRKFGCVVPLGPPSNDWREGALRVFSMGPPVLSYLQTICLPELFQFSLSVEFAQKWADPKVLLSAFEILIFLTAWGFALRYRGAAFFGLSLFLTGLVPYLEFVHFYPEWAEHYLYTPVMGLAVLLGCWIKALRAAKDRRWLRGFLVGFGLFAVFLSLRTWQRNAIYNDTERYFDCLSKSGARYAHFGYQNLGRLALEYGHPDKAIVPLKTAALIEPMASVTQNLLGLYYLQTNKPLEALTHFEEAYRNEPGQEIYRINQSYVLLRLERYEEVIKILEEIQKVMPDLASIYVNLLTSNELLGRSEKAAEWAERGVQETEGKDWEQATILMASARFFYRQDDDVRARAKIEELAAKSSKIFWYADVTKLLKGKLSPEAFLELTEHQYLGFEKVADNYVLMSYVLRGEREKAALFLDAHREAMEKIAAQQPLVKKELERAKAFIL